jgi:hypothetical protein
MGRMIILAKVILLVLILLCMSPSVVADVPPGPNVFEGTVLINGSDAPVGTAIEAYIDHGDMISDGSTTVTVAGEYSISVSSISSSDVNKNVIFKVVNINSTDMGTFKNGPIIQVLNLAVEDITAPITTDDAPSGWQNTSFTITLTASDISGSGVNSTFYKVNDGSWTTGTSVLIDTEGNNTVLYYSVDNAGNVESSNTVYAKLDTTGPLTTDDAPSSWQNSSFTINLTANDVSGSGVNSTFYKVNDGSWTSGTSVLIDTEGNNTVLYYSVDNAGNVESSNTVYAKLDTIAPAVVIDPVNAYTNVSIQTITGSVVETNLYSVTVNGELALIDGSNYSAAITLDEGENTVTIVATDGAGNTGANSTSIVLNSGPDPVPPVLSNLTIVPGKILNITTDRAIVTVNVMDEISGLNNVTIDLSEIDEPITEMTYLGDHFYSYSISTQMVGNFSFNITAVDNEDNTVTSSQFYLNVTTSDEVINTYSGGDGLSPNEIEQAIADNEAGLVSDKIVLALIEEYFR